MDDVQLDKMIEAMFQGMAKLQESQAKTDAQIAELQKSQAKTDAQLAKTDAQLARTDIQIQKSQAKTDAQIAELQKSQAKTDAQLAKTDAFITRVGKQLGSIGMNNGRFAEELFYTSLLDDPTLGGISFDVVERNIHDRKGGTEYDILMHNGEASAIIEVKYNANIKDIQALLEKKPKAFRKRYSEYGDHKLYLGLASAVTYADLITEGRKAGIFLLGQKGQHVKIINAEVKSF